MPKRQIFRSPWPSVGPFPETSLAEWFVSNPYQVEATHTCVWEGGGSRTLSFKDLCDAVVDTASGLRTHLHVHPGDIIPIVSHNCIPFITLPMGITGAGAVPAFVSPSATAEEMAHSLSLVVPQGPRYLFVAPPLRATVEEAIALCSFARQPKILAIDKQGASDLRTIEEVTAAGRNARLPLVSLSKPAAESLAMIFFSSGTTGKFKGVQLSHRNLVSNTKQLVATSHEQFSPESTMALFLPYSHIYGTCQVFGTAVTATKTVHLPRFDLIQFLEVVQKHRVTHVAIVPPVAVALAKHPIVDKYDLSSLKALVIAAAPTKLELANLLRTRLKVCVVQGFGMTEASPATHQLPPAMEAVQGSVGQLLPDMECRLVNEAGDDVGVDEEGEIVLRGPNIMLGYVRNPEATAETVKDGWLFTGDIGRVNKDGFYWIVDRKKELIKVKGFQVPPAELEGVLFGCPLVLDCAVTAHYDEDSATEYPRAFVVVDPKNRNEATASAIQDYVASKVTHYKRLRGGVFFLDEIPKSLSGKILRRMLPRDPGTFRAKL